MLDFLVLAMVLKQPLVAEKNSLAGNSKLFIIIHFFLCFFNIIDSFNQPCSHPTRFGL